MSIPTRSAITTTLVAVTLTMTLVASASAQVATLRTPDPEAESTAAPTEELDAQETILAFAACMRENGIDMPDPQFGSGGGIFGAGPNPANDGGPPFDLSGGAFRAAMEACGSFLESLAPDLDPAQQAEQNERLLSLAECMRGEGIDFPDPDPNGGFGFAVRANIDPTDPAFQDAFSSCQEASGLGFGPGGRGPAGGDDAD